MSELLLLQFQAKPAGDLGQLGVAAAFPEATHRQSKCTVQY